MMNRSSWKSGSKKVSTPWGYEVCWLALPTITGKKLMINKGKCTSLKFHLRKNEVLFVGDGKISIVHAPEKHFSDPGEHPAIKSELAPGDVLNVQAGSPYRICALEDSTVYEISDNNGEGGLVRLEDEYGRSIDANINRYRFIYPED